MKAGIDMENDTELRAQVEQGIEYIGTLGIKDSIDVDNVKTPIN